MRKILQGGLLAIFLFFISTQILAPRPVVLNENVLNQEVVDEINLIGKEFREKSGIFAGVAIGDKSDLQALLDLHKQLPQSYVLFVLSKSSHRVDIIGFKGALTLISKKAVLSPCPGTGSILPILATNKGGIHNAAILNGYGDMVDRLAQARGIELQRSIGNANRDIINILGILIYDSICFALLYYAQRRMKGKKNA